MSKHLVSLSGGMDSATVLGLVMECKSKLDEKIEGICFKYPSRHNELERQAARQVAGYYGILLREIDVSSLFTFLSSSLLLGGPPLPEGHYEAESMRQTVVPGRNLLFIATLTSIAIAEDFNHLWIGVHAGDHFIYPDCRPEFIGPLRNAIKACSEYKVQLVTPFLYSHKDAIIKFGLNALTLPVPYRLTRTCYTSNPIACGKCGSCQERLEAFAACGVIDPIQYQTRVILPKEVSYDKVDL